MSEEKKKRVEPVANPVEASAPFAPHMFRTKVDAPPSVLFTQKAFTTMYALVDECPREVGWLGLVERVPNGFLVDDIYIPEQTCTSVSTTISPDGLIKLSTELISRDKTGEILNRLRFWGHSHVNMEVEPSRQDDIQIEEFGQNSDFFIRAILNKKGKIKCDLFLFDYGITFLDVPWNIVIPTPTADRTALRQLIKQRVEVESVCTSSHRQSNFWGQKSHASRIRF
jgi:hypothetical protein